MLRSIAILTSRSDVRVEPFYSWLKDLVPSMSDVSVGHSDEQVRCKGNYHSLGEWKHLVSYHVAQSRRTGSHSDMTIGLVPTRSDMTASPSISVFGCVPLGGCKCRAFLERLRDVFPRAQM